MGEMSPPTAADYAWSAANDAKRQAEQERVARVALEARLADLERRMAEVERRVPVLPIT